jgi:hypothetical protein
VVAVWFRCQPLPFKQAAADEGRAKVMREMYQQQPPTRLIAVEVIDPPRRSS